MLMKISLKVALDVYLRLYQAYQTYEDREPRATHSCLLARVAVSLGVPVVTSVIRFNKFCSKCKWSVCQCEALLKLKDIRFGNIRCLTCNWMECKCLYFEGTSKIRYLSRPNKKITKIIISNFF